MKPVKYLSILFLFLSFQNYGQSPELTKVINKIDYQNDTLLAVYNWVTENVKYDVKMSKEMERGVSQYKKGNYKNREEYRKAQLKRVIKKKKGVCQDYTLLFQEIITQLGYTSFRVAGVTKNKKGSVAKSLGHSWIAIKDHGKWKLYDPTWGAGYVNKKKKFVKRYSDEWYDVDPHVMMEQHFPYDPIWQFVANPLTFNEFKKNKPGQSNSSSDFESLRSEFMKKNERDRCADELSRLELEKTKFKLITKRKDYLSNVANKSIVNNILDSCRANSATFSEYINEGKNQRFTGKKWTKDYSINTLLETEASVERSILDLKEIKPSKSKNKKMISNTISKSKKLLSHIKKELKILQAL